MSTELSSIQGKIEISIPSKMESEYKSTKLDLTIFSGGKERGVSLQIGFYNELGIYNHVQLDSKSIEELKNILNTEF